jgi:uncharacterized protein (TIGR03435 family)
MTRRLTTPVAAVLFCALAAPGVRMQTPSAPEDVTFDVVSVKPHEAPAGATTPFRRFGPTVAQRPDGGITMLDVPTALLIARAYSVTTPADIVGLPGWATTDRYDVVATSSLSSATPEQEAAMVRAMLADRFKLSAHYEDRDQPVYDLVVARKDGRLGSGVKASDADCVANATERGARGAGRGGGFGGIGRRGGGPPSGRSDRNGPPPPCSFRMTGDRIEGDTTMPVLARVLRAPSGRFVIDKTGLTGSYRILLTFDRASEQGGRGRGRGPQTEAPTGDVAPSIFTAIHEQLGLKLEPAHAVRETLVIDRLERPSEN